MRSKQLFIICLFNLDFFRSYFFIQNSFCKSCPDVTVPAAILHCVCNDNYSQMEVTFFYENSNESLNWMKWSNSKDFLLMNCAIEIRVQLKNTTLCPFNTFRKYWRENTQNFWLKLWVTSIHSLPWVFNGNSHQFATAKPTLPTTTEHINGRKESERAEEILNAYIREHRTAWERIEDGYEAVADSVSRNYYGLMEFMGVSDTHDRFKIFRSHHLISINYSAQLPFSGHLSYDYYTKDLHKRWWDCL